ncbi:hypothetical protein ACFLS0_00565 [Candidatus Bipolaricaulota bacterium]
MPKRRLVRVAVIGTVVMLVSAGATWGQSTDPFEELHGSVAEVEVWTYGVEEKFGQSQEEWTAHALNLYDANGNRIESTHYTEAGGIRERFVYEFDSTGRETQADEFDMYGQLAGRTISRYEGSVQIERAYDSTGDLIGAYDTETKPGGSHIVTTYDSESGDVSSVMEFLYNGDGNLISWRITAENGTPISLIVYDYGEDGMDAISTASIYLLGVELMKVVLGTELSEVDEFGNWTEKRKHKLEERFGTEEWVLSSIERRSIIYR